MLVRVGVRLSDIKDNGEGVARARGHARVAIAIPRGARPARAVVDMLQRALVARVFPGWALSFDAVRWPIVGRWPSPAGVHIRRLEGVLSRDMTPYQQSLMHLILGVVAIVAAVALSITNHVSGTDALAIIIAAGGITGTGIAAVAGAPSSTTVVTPAPRAPAPIA